jgi:Tfp pilus assembly protein PilF
VKKRGKKSRGKGLLITTAVLVLAGLGAVGVFALSHRKDAQDYLADAQVYLQKGNVSAALIQLRNAVQRAPDNGIARYQLATALLRAGDAISAEKEIRIAQERGVSDDDVLPVLAATYLEQGKSNLLLDTIAEGNRSTEAESEIRTLRGLAYLALRDLPKAEKSFTSALAINPEKYRAEIGLARIDSARLNYDGAVGRLDGVLA